MFSGVLALLERSLRVDARALAPHLARFGLMATIYVAVCYASSTSGKFGAPGLRFFQSIAYLNLVFMTLMGVSYFSTTITEEKEEDTLGLMMMAGISPLSLLLGKSVAPLIQAMLLICVQYPFTILAVTMGGVTQDQVRATYVAMLAHLILLSGVGLLCSTVSARNRTASLRMTLFVIVSFLIPAICGRSLAFFSWKPPALRSALQWISESSVFLQMGDILASGFQEALISPQVITNIAIGCLGYVLSWCLFGQVVQNLSTEPTTRGLTARSTNSLRIFSAGRPKVEPFAWKDFYFVGGGIGAMLIRFALYIAVYFVAVLIAEGLLFGGLPTGRKAATGIYLVLMMFAIAIDAGLVVSRSLHEEFKGQTLTSLILTPSTTGWILYAKIVGSLLVWLPAPACLIFGITQLPDGYRCVDDFFRRPGPPFWLIAHLLFVPHAAAVAATFVRWGALPIAIGLSIGSGFLSGSFFNAIRASDNHPAVYLVALFVLGLCAASHLVVWLRVEAISAK
jgi:ABC-type Na+ efflux pump permease subunit